MTANYRKNSSRSAVALVAFTIVATATAVLGQEVSYTGSLQFSTGDYIFTQRTNSYYFYNGLAISHKAFRLSASIPFIRQNTPWVTTSPVAVPTGGTQHSEVSRGMRGRGHSRGDSLITLVDTTAYDELGVGDPIVHADFAVLHESGLMPSIRLSADAKIPVADIDRGFGTGEWDYGAGISLAKSFSTTFLFADATYWVLGDLPDLELKNSLAYSLAFGRPLSDGKIGLLASISGYTRILDNTDPPLQVGLGLNYQLDSSRSILSNLAFGLTESTPDFSFSLGWRLNL